MLASTFARVGDCSHYSHSQPFLLFFILTFPLPPPLQPQRLSAQASARSASAPPGLWQQLFDLPTQVPLSEEAPNVPAPAGAPAPIAAQVTKLGNGLTVVSEDRHGSVSSRDRPGRARAAGARAGAAGSVAGA